MSTPDPGSSVDVAALAKVANELFRGIDGAGSAPMSPGDLGKAAAHGSPPVAPSFSPVIAAAPPQTPAPSSEVAARPPGAASPRFIDQRGAAPAGAPGAPEVPRSSAPSPPTAPRGSIPSGHPSMPDLSSLPGGGGVPGFNGELPSSSAPGFYFLETAAPAGPSPAYGFDPAASRVAPSAQKTSGAPKAPVGGAMPGGHGLPDLSAFPGGGGVPGFDGQLPASMTPSYYFLDQAAPDASTPTPTFGSDLFQVGPDLIERSGASLGHFDPYAVRADFPILNQYVNGKPLVWLDNAATTQKPQAVINRLTQFYTHENSNIHRAAHTLAARSTEAYESARDTVKRFLNASSAENIVFARGATEAINLVAQSWGRRYVNEGDEIVISWIEHHSNIVPWQMLASERGARLRVAPVDDSGQVILEEYEKLLNSRTRIVSITHVSNALGTVLPVREMVAMAHRHGARVLVDGAQAVSHLRVDVQALDTDFYVFSGHKVFGPTGIGVIYGKSDVLQSMPPWQGGGNMIADVTFDKTVYNPPPNRFEAGTGNIADAVGLGAALRYLMQLGLENVAHHEHDLLVYGTEALQTIPGLRLVGTAAEKAGVMSFVVDGYRSEDIGAALDKEGLAVRAGHHCAQPALRRFGLETTVRPSLAVYNTCEDIDALTVALRKILVGKVVPKFT